MTEPDGELGRPDSRRAAASSGPDPGLRIAAYFGSALAGIGIVSGVVMITRSSTDEGAASGRVLLVASLFLVLLVGVAVVLLRTKDDV